MEAPQTPAVHVIDGNPKTIWGTHNGTPRAHDVPQSLTIDMGKPEMISAVEELPRQDGTAHAVVDRYELRWSQDGKQWSHPMKGEFSNIRNNPIYQTIQLKKPVTARYLKFTATRVLEKNNVTVAEIRALRPSARNKLPCCSNSLSRFPYSARVLLPPRNPISSFSLSMIWGGRIPLCRFIPRRLS